MSNAQGLCVSSGDLWILQLGHERIFSSSRTLHSKALISILEEPLYMRLEIATKDLYDEYAIFLVGNGNPITTGNSI